MCKNLSIQLLLTISLIFTACSDEEGIAPENLPTLVLEYINNNYANYTIDEAESEVLCDGTSVYEIELESPGGEELELVFDTEGSFLYEATEIKSDALPTEITATVSSNYPNATLDDHAERHDWADESIQYEVELKNEGTKLEVTFDQSGNLICEEEDND